MCPANLSSFIPQYFFSIHHLIARHMAVLYELSFSCLGVRGHQILLLRPSLNSSVLKMASLTASTLINLFFLDLLKSILDKIKFLNWCVYTCVQHTHFFRFHFELLAMLTYAKLVFTDLGAYVPIQCASILYTVMYCGAYTYNKELHIFSLVAICVQVP